MSVLSCEYNRSKVNLDNRVANCQIQSLIHNHSKRYRCVCWDNSVFRKMQYTQHFPDLGLMSL
jgi:hypothetical protein